MVDKHLNKLVTSLYHSNVDSSKLMKPDYLENKFSDLFTHQHINILKQVLLVTSTVRSLIVNNFSCLIQ